MKTLDTITYLMGPCGESPLDPQNPGVRFLCVSYLQINHLVIYRCQNKEIMPFPVSSDISGPNLIISGKDVFYWEVMGRNKHRRMNNESDLV